MAHAQYLATLEPPPTPGDVQLGEIVRWLADHLPDDAIVANGAGNYCVWVNGYYQYRGYRSQLGPTSGSMGYGTPAAIAAKLVHPERTVVCFAGDGCFLMTGQELRQPRSTTCRSSGSSPTTACTALSACIRSATIPAECRAPISGIPTSPRWPTPMEATARW